MFLLRSFLWEQPRGIDFSLRQKTIAIKTIGNHGYALTQKKSFDNMMSRIDINSKDKFIDIGCGKGGCLYYASKYPFCRIAGIEVEDSLYNIAVKNFETLKMPKIEIFHDNAVKFASYSDFNVFYMFNPFEADIYKAVIDKIFDTLTPKRVDNKVYIICYGATTSDYIQSQNTVELVSHYVDTVRGTSVNIWQWKRKEEVKN